MMKKSSVYISENKQSLPVPKTARSADSLVASNSDYVKEEKAAIIMKKDLPADHLTATYWG